jgi:hypothetical protein
LYKNKNLKNLKLHPWPNSPWLDS